MIFLDEEHADNESFIKLWKGLWAICSENFYFKIIFFYSIWIILKEKAQWYFAISIQLMNLDTI